MQAGGPRLHGCCRIQLRPAGGEGRRQLPLRRLQNADGPCLQRWRSLPRRERVPREGELHRLGGRELWRGRAGVPVRRLHQHVRSSLQPGRDLRRRHVRPLTARLHRLFLRELRRGRRCERRGCLCPSRLRRAAQARRGGGPGRRVRAARLWVHRRASGQFCRLGDGRRPLVRHLWLHRHALA